MITDSRDHPILAPAHSLVVNNASQDLDAYLWKDLTTILFRDSYGFTLLHWAAMCGHTQSVKLLIEAGVDVNAVCNRGRSALMWAAGSAASLDVCKVLIEEGVDVHIVDQRGETALIRALSVAPVCGATINLLLQT